ncbi:hypothetical protein [Haloquadratum walsbyi]|uniref:Uncharacterized protein n=1 Tax=Haloquadratum walsbyi J07HQW2 TaxID=1238425 RepID=U1PQ56_9EURY|nr:hypothetical protein [Haloquadratum walsbyi]ERG94446.1 MAG: hypothetical protein J07HQW2_00880 [Haloquadratum walsbyi J07HQW2]
MSNHTLCSEFYLRVVFPPRFVGVLALMIGVGVAYFYPKSDDVSNQTQNGDPMITFR